MRSTVMALFRDLIDEQVAILREEMAVRRSRSKSDYRDWFVLEVRRVLGVASFWEDSAHAEKAVRMLRKEFFPVEEPGSPV